MNFWKIISNRELEWALQRNAKADPAKREPVPIKQGVCDCMQLINATDDQYAYYDDRLHLFCSYGNYADVAPLFAKADLHDVVIELESYYGTAGYALLIRQLCECTALLTTVYKDSKVPKMRFFSDRKKLLQAIEKLMRL